jgi:hypothetical protein
MTDETKVELSDESGGVGSPNQNLSNSNTNSIPVQGVEDVKRLESVVETLKKELKGLQGRQDKETTAFQAFLTEFKKQKKNGLDDTDAEVAASNVLEARSKEAKRDQAIDLLIQKFGLSEVSAELTGNKGSETSDYNKVISEFGADVTSPEVAALLKESNTPVELAIKLGKMNRGAMPTKPQAAAVIGQPPAPPTSHASLEIEIAGLMKNPSANKRRMDEIKKELGW